MTLQNDYAQLPATLYTRIDPTPVVAPRLIKFNAALADELQLDLDPGDPNRLAQLFSGNDRLAGSQPLAMAYAGHQFGSFVPRLGDGRAILLGEARDRHGVLKDVQLKGAGRTLYSRSGDGRAALGPVLREYLVSEAMTALGIASTRSLAAVLTGEQVRRGTALLPGAILTRVASSHVRVGTFQYLASRGDGATLKRLADYLIDRHYPEARGSQTPYVHLLGAIVERQASLIAQWMRVGFIHGVMNTDNTSVVGETIDFGPCAFLDAYDPQAVFSSIDQTGRYAFANQPAIAQWNLARLAETLLPLIDADEQRAIAVATESINEFTPAFQSQYLRVMRSKLGLQLEDEQDSPLIGELLEVMHRAGADYTVTFRGLCECLQTVQPLQGLEPLLAEQAFGAWLARWRARGERETVPLPARAAAMRAVNPAYIPRNHRIEEVISAATLDDDFAPFESLLNVILRPYDEQPESRAYQAPPRPEQRVLETFCGT